MMMREPPRSASERACRGGTRYWCLLGRAAGHCPTWQQGCRHGLQPARFHSAARPCPLSTSCQFLAWCGPSSCSLVHAMYINGSEGKEQPRTDSALGATRAPPSLPASGRGSTCTSVYCLLTRHNRLYRRPRVTSLLAHSAGPAGMCGRRARLSAGAAPNTFSMRARGTRDAGNPSPELLDLDYSRH